MGTWGAALFEDDVALDVRDVFEEAIHAGKSPEEAAERVLEELGVWARDVDEGPVVLLALASLLLDLNVSDHCVLEEAREILRSRTGLERWCEAGDEALAERREVYRRLQARLAPSETEPRP